MGKEGPDLLGRVAELGRLDDLMAGLPDGGGALLVRGDPGIGKSALLRAAAATARRRGMRILETAGVESEAQLPFAGLHEVLHPVIGGASALPAPQRQALQSAFGLADRAAPDRVLIALGALNLLAEGAGETAIMVVIDDAHWLDQTSADALAFVARRLESEPLVLVAAVRDGQPSPFLDAGLPEARLAPLGGDDAGALLDEIAPELTAGRRARVLEEAAGNPLAIVELATAAGPALETDAPGVGWVPMTERLERSFASRIPALPPETRTLLLMAALNDGQAPAESLQAAGAVLGRQATIDDLAPAVAARLVEEDGRSIRFRHPLVRSAVQQQATVVERRAAHAALAGVLGDAEDRRVWHLAASADGPEDGIADELEASALRSQQRGGTVAAVSALERAAALSSDRTTRTNRLLRAAELGVELGQEGLVDRLLHAVDPLELTPEHDARIVWIRGRPDDGVREDPGFASHLTALAIRIAERGDPDLALKLLDRAALRCFWTADTPADGDSVIDAADRIAVDPHDARVLAIDAFANAIRRGEAVTEGLRSVAVSGIDDAATFRLLGAAALMVGDFDLARARYTRSIPELRAQGRLGLLTRALTALAWSAGHLADLTTAIPAGEEASRMARETNQPIMYATARSVQAMLAALRGDEDQVGTYADEAEAESIVVGARPVLAMLQHARGLSALGAGRHAEAFDSLRRMHYPADPAYHFSLRCSAFGDFAEAAAHSGNVDAGRDVLAGLEAVGGLSPSPALHAGLRHARALLAEDRDAEHCYLRALEADASRAPFARARAQLSYGAWLRRHRRQADSRAPLRAARDTFDALGAIPWGERARQELRASGETSRRRVPDARDRLTPQELQIAQMAATGLTNREIGDRLYLSHRTVGAHLHRIFPKLEITSRSQLAASLAHGSAG
jgi:DNA-binding CsgD family transcriptional regulator